MAKGKFARIAFFSMVAVVYFIFAFGIAVVAMVFGKYLVKVANAVHRRKQYREQECPG